MRFEQDFSFNISQIFNLSSMFKLRNALNLSQMLKLTNALNLIEIKNLSNIIYLSKIFNIIKLLNAVVCDWTLYLAFMSTWKKLDAELYFLLIHFIDLHFNY